MLMCSKGCFCTWGGMLLVSFFFFFSMFSWVPEGAAPEMGLGCELRSRPGLCTSGRREGGKQDQAGEKVDFPAGPLGTREPKDPSEYPQLGPSRAHQLWDVSPTPPQDLTLVEVALCS